MVDVTELVARDSAVPSIKKEPTENLVKDELMKLQQHCHVKNQNLHTDGWLESFL